MEKKKYRPFQISCGLKEGYSLDSPVHTIADARAVIKDWLEKRAKFGKKVAVGTLIEGQFIYPWTEGQEISSRHEPAFHYKGMIREDASEEEALEMLEDLTREFAQRFNQKRIHIEFCSSYFLFEKK
jgi:hypothetical protein